ncbi:MAG TPA: hypothetical protein VEP90_23890 [Methylomirabilota bacterium]|nr:hypothetical protein [Methylomirabilota bacterium]
MSYTLSFSGNSPIIDAHIHPIINLSERAWTKHNVDWSHTHSWVIGLSHFSAFNTVHNITEKNNKFYFISPSKVEHVVGLTPGSYTFHKLFNTLRTILTSYAQSTLDMRGDITTGQVYLFSETTIDFSKKDSFGALLGFNGNLIGNQPHYSPKPLTITDKNYIRIICNIVDGSYTNGEREHVIHEFFTNLQPGYNIVERPRPIIYLPINATQIDRIILRLVDRNGEFIDFGPQPITIQLHLHRVSWQ